MPRWIRLRLGSLAASYFICLWPGAVGSIPSGIQRSSYYDGKFLLGSSTGVNPGGLGGADEHIHESNFHTHPFSGGASSGTRRNSVLGRSKEASVGHIHGSATSNPASVTVSPASNNPPYIEMISLKLKLNMSVPNGGVGFFASSPFSAGWDFCDGTMGTLDMRNRFPRGSPSGSGGGATGGSSDSHTHVNTHGHSGKNSAPSDSVRGDGAGSGIANALHLHLVSLNAKSITINAADGQPPFRKLIPAQNNTGGDSSPSGLILPSLVELNKIPSGWLLCDGTSGTPDMRTYFVKCVNDVLEVLSVGGSTEHSHVVVDHNHTPSALAGSSSLTYDNLGSVFDCSDNHTHPWTVGNGVVVIDSALSYPKYRTVAFLMKA